MTLDDQLRNRDGLDLRFVRSVDRIEMELEPSLFAFVAMLVGAALVVLVVLALAWFAG